MLILIVKCVLLLVVVVGWEVLFVVIKGDFFFGVLFLLVLEVMLLFFVFDSLVRLMIFGWYCKINMYKVIRVYVRSVLIDSIFVNWYMLKIKVRRE